MPEQNVRGHSIPAVGEHPSRDGIFDPLLTVNDIVMAANATDRAQKLTDIGSTAARPLIVRQQDTETYWEHNGTDWRELLLPPADASFTLDTSLWNLVGSAVLQRRSGVWFLSVGFQQRNNGGISAAWNPVGTVPSEARLAVGGVFFGAGHVNAPAGPAVARINRATGVVEMLTPAFSGTTNTTYNVGISWPAT